MKKIIILFALLGLISCATKPYFEYFGNSQKYSETKIYLRNIKIKIDDRKIWPIYKNEYKYLTEEEVAEFTKQEIIKKLKKDGFYGEVNSKNTLEYDLSINYDRMFMMFTNHAYIGTALRKFEINIYENSELIAKKFSKKRKTADLDFGGKIKKISKSITFSYNKENEKNEIIIFARYIAQEMEDFITVAK